MKKTYLFGMFAALAFASCSSDNEPANNQGGATGELGYLAVKIATNADTRAGEDGGFKIGTENDVKNALFIFYDAAGNYIESKTPTLTFNNNNNNTNPDYEKESDAVLVLNKADYNPTQVLTVLNYTPAMKNALEGKTITSAVGVVETSDKFWSEGDGDAKKDYFVMSTSQYWQTAGQNNTTSVAGKVFTDSKTAQANPVIIYVERVASKVYAKTADTFNPQNPKITLDGTPNTELGITLRGINVANMSEKTYLVKKIENYSDWTAFNDPSQFRSYWTTIPASMTYGNWSWNEYATTAFDKTKDYNFYTLENTNQTQPTDLVISAQITKNGNPVSIIYYGGNYYEYNDETLNVYGQLLKDKGYKMYTKQADNSLKEADITTDCLAWLTQTQHEAAVKAGKIKAYQTYAVFTLPEGATLKNGEENATAEDVNTLLQSNDYVAQIWNNGMCYYYVNVEHFGPVAPYTIGVVRNHLYEITVNTLKGLGTPVFYPDEKIIPEKRTTDEFYMYAKVRILKWKVVRQTGNFD